MTLTLVTIPCRTDNYAYLLHNAATGQTALVDAPDVPAITAALDARGWQLTDILVTHHHDDHISGVEALRGLHAPRVIGAAADAHRLPRLDLAVSPGDPLVVAGADVSVIDAPGHTLGHIAFHFVAAGLAFTADSLMAMGCGRLFEGTPAQMWDTMQRLRALPDATLICSGHEYTASNARFAATLEPGNPALLKRIAQITADRAAGRFTVPSLLWVEKLTNPFLRADDPALAAAIGLPDATALEVFTEIRRRKDKF